MQVHAKVFFFYQLVATIPGFMQTDYSRWHSGVQWVGRLLF